MGHYPYIRCLFCQGGWEKSIVKRIGENRLGVALHPQKVEPFYRNGVWRDVQKPLLPGYVFVYAREAYPGRSLLNIAGVIRLLTYGNGDHDGYLNEGDRRFADWLLRNCGVVEKLKAVRQGSYVRVVDGFLKDCNGTVEKVNKQQRTAFLTLEAIGSVHHIWLGLEYIEERPDAAAEQKWK